MLCYLVFELTKKRCKSHKKHTQATRDLAIYIKKNTDNNNLSNDEK